VEQISICSLWKGPHARAGECLKEAVTLRRHCAGAGCWQDFWTCGERIPLQSRFSSRTCDPMRDPHWSSLFLKDYTLWNGPMEQFMMNCSPWECLTLEKSMKNCFL